MLNMPLGMGNSYVYMERDTDIFVDIWNTEENITGMQCNRNTTLCVGYCHTSDTTEGSVMVEKIKSG
jgi:hypothetical protein